MNSRGLLLALVLSVACLALAMPSHAQTTWFVDDDAPNDPGPGDPLVSDPLEDGSADHPYDAIQEGIDAASGGDTVLVADGTYTGDGNRDLDFGGKAITVRSENGVENCIIDIQGSEVEPHRGFYFHSGEGLDSVVEGITIQNGYDARDNSMGGGIYCETSSPMIVSCIIRWNAIVKGGGVVFNNSSAIITNCTILGNTALTKTGGGIHLRNGSSALIANCVIKDNIAPDGWGGGIHCFDSSPTIINNLIIGNEAYGSDYQYGSGGGGICVWDNAYPTIVNNTIVGNSATGPGYSGSGIFCNWGASPSITNCIIWNNTNDGVDYANGGPPSINYSDIQGGWAGIGNIDADPLFVTGPGGDFYLSQLASGQGSDCPCLDAGSDLAANICFDSTGGTICLDQLTTRTDQVFDSGQVDMGFHYGVATPIPQNWTWEKTGALSGALRVYSLCEVPGVGLFAGTNPTGNVYFSSDSGDSWTETAELAGAVHVYDLLPASDGRIYAATKGEVGTTDGHVFYTANLGGSWMPTADLGVDVESVFCLLDRSGGELLAGSGPNGDIFRSADSGLSWTTMGDLAGAESVNVLLEAADGMLYAGTSPNGDVFRSNDGGYNWVSTADIPLAEDVFALIEGETGEILVGTSKDGCIYRTTDLGVSWEPLDCLDGVQFIIDFAWHSDGLLYVATDDMGHVFRSEDGGASWKQTSDMTGAAQSYRLLSAGDGYLYCATGYGGDVFRNSGPPTIEASMTCIPSMGTVPFVSSMNVTMTNVYADQVRRIGGHIDVTLASGGYFPNWRSGFTNVSPGESYVNGWNQNIPDLGSVIGENNFVLFAQDVTPAPYNQPPYLPSGSTDSAECVVIGNPLDHEDHALYFDGGDRAIIQNDEVLDLTHITMECWVYFNRLVGGPNTTQYLVSKGGDRTEGAYRFYQRGYSQLDFATDHFNQVHLVNVECGLVTHHWYHIAGTYNGNEMKLYLDGNLMGSNMVGPVSMGNDSPLYLSYNDVAGYPYFLDGIIDEVRIWSYARSIEEINEAMNISLTGGEPGLVGYWKLNEGDGQQIYDETSNMIIGHLGSTEQADADDPEWIVNFKAYH